MINPEKKREISLMLLYLGLKQHDIVSAVGVSPRTVGSVKRRLEMGGSATFRNVRTAERSERQHDMMTVIRL